MAVAKIRLKPIRRSVGFWIGLCVTLFLLWVWADSRSHLTKFGVRETPRALEVTVRNSLAIIGISFPEGRSPTPGSTGWEWVWERSPHVLLGATGSPKGPWFPAGRIDRIARYAGAHPSSKPSRLMFEGEEIFIPFVVVVLLWVVIWLSTLGLYRRWQRKRAARAAPEGAEAA